MKINWGFIMVVFYLIIFWIIFTVWLGRCLYGAELRCIEFKYLTNPPKIVKQCYLIRGSIKKEVGYGTMPSVQEEEAYAELQCFANPDEHSTSCGTLQGLLDELAGANHWQ